MAWAWFSRARAAGAAKSEAALAPLTEQAHRAWHAGDLARAEALYREALALRPHHAATLSNLGMVLFAAQRQDEGYALLTEAVAADPRHGGARCNLGIALAQGGALEAAEQHLEAAIALDPQDATYANLVQVWLQTCNWKALERFAAELAALAERAEAGQFARRISPYGACLLPLARALKRRIADFHAEQIRAQHPALSPLRAPRAPRSERIRVGYLSCDFHDHATAHLSAGLYAAHDRGRFEIFAYSWGPDDGSAYRRRIVAGCDAFHGIELESYRASAERIRQDGIDILVDLKGHTGGGRPEILAYRPAPVQISLLGMPGTLGKGLADYFVTDAVTTPPGYEDEFAEQLILLPGSYQVNDALTELAPAPARADLGLPERGFVFCAFNALYKIEAVIFGAWMQILQAVPQSVLWLLQGNATAQARIEQECARLGVDPGRLRYAPFAARAAHLARMQRADLFLDTHFVNAHTSASDALRAGVPVLTWPGASFAGRVACGLAHAAGLQDLAAASREDYVSKAVALAGNPAQLAAVRARLLRQRASPLFDTARYARHLERAYELARARRHSPPARIGLAEA